MKARQVNFIDNKKSKSGVDSYNMKYIERIELLKIPPLGNRKLTKQMSLLKRIYDKSIFIPFYWINKISFKHNIHGDIEITLPPTRISKCHLHTFIIISWQFNNLPNHVRN